MISIKKSLCLFSYLHIVVLWLFREGLGTTERQGISTIKYKTVNTFISNIIYHLIYILFNTLGHTQRCQEKGYIYPNEPQDIC